MALHFAAMLDQLRGDAEATARHAQASFDLATDEGFSFWHAGAQVFRGWATVARACAGAGDHNFDAGLAEIRRGLDAWLATGSRTYQTYYLGLLADTLQRMDRHREALRPLDEALAAAQFLPEGLYEPELYRLCGRSALHTSNDPASQDARDCFDKAVRIARAQGARFFEDRAAADLASGVSRRAPARQAGVGGSLETE